MVALALTSLTCLMPSVRGVRGRVPDTAAILPVIACSSVACSSLLSDSKFVVQLLSS